MPVEFLTDEQAAAYGRYTGPVPRADLDRYFFLDDADRALITPKRREANRLGYAVQSRPRAGAGGRRQQPLPGHEPGP